MIAYIKGTLEQVGEDHIVVECQQMGYEVKIPTSCLAQLPSLGNDVKIFTYLYVREDAMQLYGFMSEDDLSVFKLLLTVNGIGPKGALNILSAITPDELRFAVVTNDDQRISKAPGIGKKTAQKLILDLKDKLKIKDVADVVGKEVQGALSKDIGPAQEALLALTSLGYSYTEANKAVKAVEGSTVEEIIKLALKQLAKL